MHPNWKGCTIHLLEGKDAAELAALEAACFSTSWNTARYRALLETGQEEKARGVPLSAPVFGLRTAKGRLAAYAALALHAAAGEAEIYNIAVAADFRQKGYGRLLLRHAMQWLGHAGIRRIFLEVRTGNAPALALYAAAGFNCCGRRNNYYADTGEDALVLCCDLPPSRTVDPHGGTMQLLMAANWKMYKSRQDAASTITELARRLTALPEEREVAVFAPFTALAACSEALAAHSRIALGGQNCYPADQGAYTGEISPGMLQDCGCAYVLAGHSERRALLRETDAFVGEKTAFALQSGLRVVLCIGETLEQRDQGQLAGVLERQLAAGLGSVVPDIPAPDISIAYEPVWAIGTGRVAGPAEIIEAHALIRSFLKKRFPEQGDAIRILYGGSVKPDNAGEIISLDNVNGVLVGGASLQAESFSRIVLA